MDWKLAADLGCMCRYWQVVLGGVSVGSSDAGIVAQTAILDSGTTALITSLDDAQSIHSVRAHTFVLGCVSFAC